MNRQLTQSDMNRRSLREFIRHEVSCLRFDIDRGDTIERELTASELKASDLSAPEVHAMVRDALLDNDEIGQAMAHAKVAARIPASFCVDGAHFYNHSDLLLFDILLMDVLGFSERETIEVISEDLKSWTSYVNTQRKAMSAKVAEVLS